MNTIKGAWEFIINASAGLGFVLILRWFWWRLNAWSEIVAMIFPIVIYFVIIRFTDFRPPYTIYFTTFSTIIVTIIVTIFTKPVQTNKLIDFYKKVHPYNFGWKKIHKLVPEVKSDNNFKNTIFNWIFGVIIIYSILFAIGEFLFGYYKEAFFATCITIIFVILLLRNMSLIKNLK